MALSTICSCTPSWTQDIQYAYDLVFENRVDLQHMIDMLELGMTISVEKTKVISVGSVNSLLIILRGQPLEEVDSFSYVPGNRDQLQLQGGE